MTPVGRIVHARDFQTVLATAARARSEHFALHHVATLPVRGDADHADTRHDLSTARQPFGAPGVDGVQVEPPKLGLVVPKRYARRAVTRTLLKRQMRAAMQRHAAGLAGWWVVRLRVAFAVTQFRSAASELLRRAASAELDALFASGRKRVGVGQAARRVPDAAAGRPAA